MAIVTGISGNTNTIDTTGSEVTIWTRSVNSGSPVQFTFGAGVANITFRVYADEDSNTQLAEIIVPTGETRTFTDTRRDSIALVTAESASGTAVPSWYASIVGGA